MSRTRQRTSTLWTAIAAACLVAACAGATPGASSAPGASGTASSPAASGVAPEGVALVDLADTGEPAALAQRELDLVRETRESAGMAGLIGEEGPAAFGTLDAIEAEFAQGVLREVATAVDAGEIPQAAIDPLAGQLASIGGGLPLRSVTPGAIDVSVFAETGFTTSALMGLFSQLVERAAESRSGTIPRQESRDETADGLRQQVDLNTTMTIQTGGGRVSADITMSATDRISDAASGSFVALYTSTSSGHFDVSACPDRNGVAEGTYTFETKHELNDVSGAATSRSGAGRSVDAPFRLINSEEAHLTQIEASLDLKADARAPGSADGSGAFDWNASQSVQIVMPAGGHTTGSGGAATVTGTGGERAAGAMFFSSAMAQLFLGQVGKEAERFWRSGKCIELVPSDDTRDVDASEEIDLTVEAKAKFSGGESIEKPITATFSGVKSLEPTGRPVDAPAEFHFVAGTEDGEKGTIDLEQVSNRGIGRRQVVYTVRSVELEVEIRSTMSMQGGGTRFDGRVVLDPLPLTRGDDGTYSGTGTAQWTTTITPGTPECRPKTYENSFPTTVTARIDPTDPERVLVRATVDAGQMRNETIICKGTPITFIGSTFLGGWAMMTAREHSVPIDGSAGVPSLPLPGGTSESTIFVRKRASS